MAYTQSDLIELDKAIASGVLRAKHADRDVTYRSLDEMLQTRAIIAQQLAQADYGGIVWQTVGHSKGIE